MEFKQVGTMTIELPSQKGSEVVIKKKMTVNDGIVSANITNDPSAMADLLASVIVSWNFTKNGQPMPITKENLLLFPLEDGTFILEKIAPQKKTDSEKTK